MAKKAAVQKAEKAQPVKGAAKSNGNSAAKLKNSVKNSPDKVSGKAVQASSNGGSKAGKPGARSAKALADKKTAGVKRLDPVSETTSQAGPQAEKPQKTGESLSEQANAIMVLKRKLHFEIFEKCLEKKIFQDQDLDFWDS